VSIADVKRRYRSLDFDADRLTDGRRRWLSQSDGGFLMEAIGDPENLHQMTLMISTGMSPRGAQRIILGYLTFALQDEHDGLQAASAEAWVQIMMEAATYDLTTPGSDGNYEGTTRLAGFELTFSTSAVLQTMTLIIEKGAPQP